MGRSRRTKQLALLTGFFGLALLLAQAREVTNPQPWVTPESRLNLPSFKKEIFPIIQEKCSSPACHGPKNRVTHRYTDYAKVYANRKAIKKRIAAEIAPMPPAGSPPLSEKEKQLMLQWLAAGAPNN